MTFKIPAGAGFIAELILVLLQLEQAGSVPRAQSPEPRAQSPKPRAQSPEPRAQSLEPRARPLSRPWGRRIWGDKAVCQVLLKIFYY